MFRGHEAEEVSGYLLTDWSFLNDYEVTSSPISISEHVEQFIARIKDTQMSVRFTKYLYSQETFHRFKALYQLFEKGIVLADNMFIVRDGKCSKNSPIHIYVIEANLTIPTERFQTLQQYLNGTIVPEEIKKSVLMKAKLLLDSVHESGIHYCGLNTEQFVIDEQMNLYLQPCSLHTRIELDSSYHRAYYPPEILTASEINPYKWDAWAFGCICMQILYYASPLFMSTSISKQLAQIDSFSLETESDGKWAHVLEIIRNSLQTDPNRRSIEAHPTEETQSSEETIPETSQQNYATPTCQSVLETTPAEQSLEVPPQQEPFLKQLNCTEAESGPCRLQINFFSLCNVNVKSELRLTVKLDRKYAIHIDASPSSRHRLNTKITLNNTFAYFEKLLSLPVTIEFVENEKRGQARLNLQTLVLVDEGKRVWDDVLLGSYGVDGAWPAAKIKISCILIGTPPQQSKNYQDKENKQPVKRKQEIKAVFQRKASSIAEITEDLETLTQHWKRKIAQN